MRYTSKLTAQQDVADWPSSTKLRATWTTSRGCLERRSTNSWRYMSQDREAWHHSSVNLWSRALICRAYNHPTREGDTEREREREREINLNIERQIHRICLR